MNITVSSEITAKARLAANLLATSMEVLLVGYKTIESYARNLRGAVRGLWSGEFDTRAFHLNEKFDWVIARDSGGQLLLIPSEKYLN